MSSDRLLCAMLAALAILGGACTSHNSGGTKGAGGAQASGGHLGQGAMTGLGGNGGLGGTSDSGGSGSGGANGTGGRVGSGGTSAAGGATGSGGAGAGGATGSGGAATGGAIGSGGALGGATGSGGQPGVGGAGVTGGASGRDAGPDVATGAGETGAGGGSGTDGSAVPSKGCGKTATLKNSPTTKINYNQITSSGTSRQYILRYPDNYDNNHPYRLILAYHWSGGSAAQVFDCNQESSKCSTTQSPFFGLWNLAKDSTIFIALDGLNGGWDNTNGRDFTFTDDVLTQVEADLCIDTSRVFANGFSFGAVMSAQLACVRPAVFRAVGVYSGSLAFGSATNPCDGTSTPVAYYGSHGTKDNYSYGTTARDHFAQINGCKAQTPPDPPAGGHLCTSYQGCSSGHPVRWCAFDGSAHTPSPVDNGTATTWNPQEAWSFFTQF
jgi:poly(3-hydroxybutyrate) depolymerase